MNYISELSIINEWDYEKNHELDPHHLSIGSNRKVWWKCNQGHEWQAIIATRARLHSGCPYCSGRIPILGKNDLATTHPELAAEWNGEKNGSLVATEVKCGSSRKVWWKCSTCSFEWEAIISSRSRGNGCPNCGRIKQTNSFRKNRIKKNGALIETHPLICSEWNYDRNQGLHPSEFTYGSKKKVWWICSKGHEWEASINSRVQGTRCPKCVSGLKTSLPEKALAYYLKLYGYEVEENAKVFGDTLREVDIYIPRLKMAVEYDGEHWHKNNTKDDEKTVLCKQLNIQLIRIREPQIGLLNDGYSIEHLTSIPKNDLSHINESVIWLLSLLGHNVCDIDANRDMPHIRSMIQKEYDTDSFGNQFPALIRDWDAEKNGSLSPFDISKCSGVMVWWLCSNAHSWQDSIAHRINGRNCPYCSGRRTLPGFNDLQTKYPEIAAEWDYEQNKPLIPSHVSYRNGRKVWWICSNGHKYQATVAHRTTDNTSCPYCANQKVLIGYNDLKTCFPAIAMEWNYNKNDNMLP